MDPAWRDALLSMAHFMALLVMAGALSGELFVMRLAPSQATLRLLSRMDIFYGGAALLLIAAGLGRVFFGLKDAGYYAGSHAFWGKMATFAVIGLISIWPTVKFIQWRRAADKDGAFAPPEAQWKAARRIVLVEAHLLVLVVIFAALMARGLG